MSHTFDPEGAGSLEDLDRFRYLSRDELVDALGVDGGEVVADIGSGTGFYTREVAPFVDHLYAVDMQEEMHAHFSNRSLPENVELVLSPAKSLPFEGETVDALYSTMTFHEVSEAAPAEFYRVLKHGGRIVIADWSARGKGERGPGVSERTDAANTVVALETAGFEIDSSQERPETFLVSAVK